MTNIIKWDISPEYIEHVAARKAEVLKASKTYWYEMVEEEAFIIATYFTNAWLHTHEHVANAIPGSYPARSYDGKKMQLTIGQYDIDLTYEVLVLDEHDDWIEPRWFANITDTKTNDTLELFVQTQHYDVITYITSKKSEDCAKALANDIIRRCRNEFGVDGDTLKQIAFDNECSVGMVAAYA